jgi:hypothetical protein
MWLYAGVGVKLGKKRVTKRSSFEQDTLASQLLQHRKRIRKLLKELCLHFSFGHVRMPIPLSLMKRFMFRTEIIVARKPGVVALILVTYGSCMVFQKLYDTLKSGITVGNSIFTIVSKIGPKWQRPQAR